MGAGSNAMVTAERGTPQQAARTRRRCKPAAAAAAAAAAVRASFGANGRRRSTSTLAAVLVLLVASLQAPTCQGFVAPLATRTSIRGGTGIRGGPSLARVMVDKEARTAKLGRLRVPGGGHSLAMSAGLPSAVSSMINPVVVKASTRAVSELLCCCVLGVVAAKKGILTPVNVAALSKIVYGIFLPSLLMVNVAKTCVSQSVASLLPIPAFAGIQIALGLAISGVAMRLLRIDPDTEAGREAKVCMAFQNSGILPLIFLNAMFRGSPELLSRGVAYASFYLMGWSPTFWTIGNNILTGHLHQDGGGGGGGGGGKEKSAAEGDVAAVPKARLSLSKRVANLPSKVKSSAQSPAVRRVLSPPIVACMMGLVIGLSPPLRWLLMREGAPLGPMWSAFGNLTAAYTPSGVLVLAGSLANCPPGKWFSRDTQKTILAVGMARWFLLPLATSGLLFGGVKYGLVPPDPMLLFVLLIESCMPSAQNTVIMLQVAGLQEAAGRKARTLCTLYLISIVPVSILLTVFIAALKLV
ncbi:unnamed protein product [Ectocarpus sp. 12 AP-2014]